MHNLAEIYDLGNVKGPPGDIGPTGKTGPQGGQGPAGTAATVNVGVVTTGQPGTPAAVENAGTENAAVLNFTIPKGEKGEPGAAGTTGATGATGPIGPQGPAGKDGKSAYQSAAEGGYTGTEGELNAALAEVPGHVGDTVKHITAAERAGWDKKVKTQRFVVGTAAAGWTADDCDYLCDGTGDQAEINAAIQALPASGGAICLLDGTYNIAAPIAMNKGNVALRGNGMNTVLKRMWNSNDWSGIVTLTADGCEVSGFSIDGNNTVYRGDNCGIAIVAAGKNRIENVECKNNLVGVDLAGAGENRVENSILDNKTSIRLTAPAVGNVVAHNLVLGDDGIFGQSIKRNTIEGNTFSAVLFSIHLVESQQNIIAENTFEGNGTGVMLQQCTENTVTGNNVKSTANINIELAASNDNTVTGNICAGSAINFMLSGASGNSIVGNTCTGTENMHIYITEDPDTGGSDKNMIAGNVCKGGMMGIALGMGNHNIIMGNECYDAEMCGIALQECNNNTVSGNLCLKGSGTPADYGEEAYTIMLDGSNNLVTDNLIMGKDIEVQGGTGNTLRGNKWSADDPASEVTAEDKAAWNGKETPAGAQAKADAAEANAKAASRPNTWLPTAADIGAETPAGAQAKADAAAALKASAATYTATLSTIWSGSGPYTQTVNVAGMLATDNPVADVVLSDTAATAQAQLEAWGLVGRITTANGSITATCYDGKPGTALTVQFKVVR